MKKLLIAIMLLTIAATTTYSQEYTISQLVKSGKWKFLSEPGSKYSGSIYFTDTDYVEVWHNDGKDQVCKLPYYLSPVCPNVMKDRFDFNLVGKKTKGKYIVVKFGGEKGDWFCPFEIVQLTNKKLALKKVPYRTSYYVKE